MFRSHPRTLVPAGAAFGALLEVARKAGEAPAAGRALELARSAIPPQKVRRPGRRVPAGRLIEAIPGPRRGSPLLAPAGGALGGLDERQQRLAVYRVCAAGHHEGRLVEEGSLVLLSRRRPEPGSTVAAVDRRQVRLCSFGRTGIGGVPEGARILGVVEGVIAARRRPTSRAA